MIFDLNNTQRYLLDSNGTLVALNLILQSNNKKDQQLESRFPTVLFDIIII